MVILGFLGTIGVIVWSEHRQTRMLNARIDELKSDTGKDMAELKAEMRQGLDESKADYQQGMAELKAEMRRDMAELKAEMRTQDERHRVLEGKVDRIQGSLDVLIHAYGHEPLAQPMEERQASESSVN